MHMSIVILVLVLLLGGARGASSDLKGYLSGLPADLKLKEEGPQKYLWTCDYFQLDLQGNLVHKRRVSAEYTRGLPEGKVRWNNVRVAGAKGFEDVFPEGEKQDYMEGFTYKPSADIVKPEFFQGFPETAMETKTLVWDTVMFEGFGWNYFDKLQLNRTYYPPEPRGEIPLAGAGMFQNREIELTWIGVSQRNKEPCALIQYRAFINKVNMSFQGLSLRGRSHYWGEIWVSLKDKQIEYATLYEDVLMEVKMADQLAGQLGNVFRRGTFEKLVAEKVR